MKDLFHNNITEQNILKKKKNTRKISVWLQKNNTDAYHHHNKGEIDMAEHFIRECKTSVKQGNYCFIFSLRHS